jgi:hypothetical protein
MLTRACCAALVVVAPLAAASLGVQSPYNGGEVNNVAIIGMWVFEFLNSSFVPVLLRWPVSGAMAEDCGM